MTNKEINRASGRIFEGLLPTSWAFRSQEDQEDYGVDGEIEITTPGDKATGFLFKVQLKGVEQAHYDSAGQLVYSDASVERFSYYVHNLKIPIVFVVCDVTTKRCFWTRVQGQPQVEAALKAAVNKGQKSFTLKFSPSHSFVATEECAGEVIEAVGSSTDALALRNLKNLSAGVVGKHLAQDTDLAGTEKKFRMFAGLASLEAVWALMKAGDTDGSLEKARALLESAIEEPATRVQAGVMFSQVYAIGLRRAGTVNAAMEAAKFQLGVASAMLKIVRLAACEPRMKLFVNAYARSSRMQLNSRLMLALAVSEAVQRRQEQAMAGPFTTIERIRMTARVARDCRRIQALIGKAMVRGHYSLIPYVVDEWLDAAIPFVHALRLSEQKEAAAGYADLFWQHVPLAVEVAKNLLEPDSAKEILQMIGLKVAGLAINDSTEAEKFVSRYEAELGGAKPVAGREEIAAAMRKMITGARDEVKQKPTNEEVREYFMQQAAALGINVDDPDDRLAEIVRIGLDDLDPTRVSKNCAHIHLRPGARGIPAEMLGLVTAGFKSIHCLKHGHSMEGLKLDDVYKIFSQSMPWAKDQLVCENCPDRSPHPEGWEWKEEWEVEQAAKFQQRRKAEPGG